MFCVLCWFVYLLACPFVRRSVCLSVCLPACRVACVFVCLSALLFWCWGGGPQEPSANKAILAGCAAMFATSCVQKKGTRRQPAFCCKVPYYNAFTGLISEGADTRKLPKQESHICSTAEPHVVSVFKGAHLGKASSPVMRMFWLPLVQLARNGPMMAILVPQIHSSNSWFVPGTCGLWMMHLAIAVASGCVLSTAMQVRMSHACGLTC